ncbi:MAG: UDP-N-acetylglucosamine 4,6-dehydratase (inverting) [Acidobacteriota bacterium]
MAQEQFERRERDSALWRDLRDRSILLTGGTGSFGMGFVATVLRCAEPKRVIVFSRDELKQHEMRQRFPSSRLTFFLGDVRDRDRLYRAFKADVDIVIHAAALKQVPSCEYNPFEAVKTNVLGAQNVIDAAIDCGIPKVMAISTDKAVNPVNIYGATKLCAEKLFVQGNAYAGGRATRFSCVRYGNVLGSRGSFLPQLMRQKSHGKVLITDPRMTRFWMTTRQAVEFVVSSISLMQGGEVFVPKVPSMRLRDLVSALAPECETVVTGSRPGEKLHETLLAAEEARHAVDLGDRYVILPEHATWGSPPHFTGKKLPEGFAYNSDSNTDWLTIEELRRLVAEELDLAEVFAPEPAEIPVEPN